MVFPLLLVLMGLGSALRHVQVTNDAGAANESQNWGWLWHQEIITCSCIDGEEFTTWAKCREACDKWCERLLTIGSALTRRPRRPVSCRSFQKSFPATKKRTMTDESLATDLLGPVASSTFASSPPQRSVEKRRILCPQACSLFRAG